MVLTKRKRSEIKKREVIATKRKHIKYISIYISDRARDRVVLCLSLSALSGSTYSLFFYLRKTSYSGNWGCGSTNGSLRPKVILWAQQSSRKQRVQESKLLLSLTCGSPLTGLVPTCSYHTACMTTFLGASLSSGQKEYTNMRWIFPYLNIITYVLSKPITFCKKILQNVQKLIHTRAHKIKDLHHTTNQAENK